jgi:hypothetical protein
MKSIIKVFSSIVLLILAVSCATSPNFLPEKYNLDTYLEPVDQISSFQATSWEQIDNQSIILEATWDNYYLLILRSQFDSTIPDMTIGISSTGYTITSGFDMVIVNDFNIRECYVIEKIYKLNGKDQVQEVKIPPPEAVA